MTITRLADNRFAVTTDTVLTDGSLRADYAMKLTGTELTSISERGYIRISGNMRIKLGPKSFATVSNLAIGQTASL